MPDHSDTSSTFLPNSVAVPLAADKAAAATDPPGSSKQTARRAIEILVGLNQGFREPSARERNALLVAFAGRRKAIHGAAFDVVKLAHPVDLADPIDIAANINAICLCEIKSTNRRAIGADLAGYFFALTTAELLVAQTLGDQYRFVFVNTLNQQWQEMSLREVFGRARGIYPTWSIRF